MGSSIKASHSNMRSYFSDLKAEIPKFQRSYEWGRDEIDDFLEDLYTEVDKGVESGTKQRNPATCRTSKK